MIRKLLLASRAAPTVSITTTTTHLSPGIHHCCTAALTSLLHTHLHLPPRNHLHYNHLLGLSVLLKMLRRAVKLATSRPFTNSYIRPFLSHQRPPTFSSSSETSAGHFVEHLSGNNDPNLSSSTTISIDRSGLCNPPEHSHGPSSESELVKHLKSIVKFRGGPISVAEYMEEVLTNPNAGYYINRDVFGTEGDFITSPEVSQMFGEMIGVWAMCLWEQMGRPSKVNLVELGPGRGTLMVDLLRGTSKFENFTESVHIHLVECSPALKEIQHRNLKCEDENNASTSNNKKTISRLTGSPVSWHTAFEEVPSGVPTIIIAHEFYDALPVHQFQRASRGWCEKMIDVAENSVFRFVLSPTPTPGKLFLAKRCRWTVQEELDKLNQIEICPKAMELTESISKRISSDGGGALIIDYGLNGVISDSLQAIRKHKFVDILDEPGTADLSAYVDFESIRCSAEESSGDVSVYGPMTQSQFLGALGINFRVEALVNNCSTEEQAELLQAGYWRLVGDGEAPFWEGPEDKVPIGMGNRYLVMAIVNKNQGTPVPFQ